MVMVAGGLFFDAGYSGKRAMSDRGDIVRS